MVDCGCSVKGPRSRRQANSEAMTTEVAVIEQSIPTQREIDAYIAGFESVTVELRGYGLTESERAGLERDAVEELSR